VIIHELEQGSPEWFAIRLGKPTASNFDKILTPTGKESTQAEAYENKIVAEILTGKPVDDFEGNSWTERGNELEPSAAAFYAMLNDIDPIKVGFVTDDGMKYGCSPDRLIGDDGLLEIKCPAPHTHVKYMLDRNVDRKYYPQLQGQLFVTGRQWVDIISYHPEMKPVVIRVERDNTFIKDLSSLLDKLHNNVQHKLSQLTDKE
jgi:hypothetical protein